MSNPLIPDRITPVSQLMFEQSYGGMLICCMIMLVLYGLSVLQTYMYFLKYEDDSVGMKAMVLVVWTLGSIHSAFVCHTVYYYLVIGYTNPQLLLNGEWSVYAAICVGIVCFSIIQIFSSRMIYHMATNMWRKFLMTVFTTLILAQFVFGTKMCVKMIQLWQPSKLRGAVYTEIVPVLSIMVVSDAVTAISLCFVLYRTRPSLPSAITLVNTLIVYSINRFFLTTVVAFVQLIILIVRPDTVWAVYLEFIGIHFYINSLLATINSRSHLRNMDTGYTSTPQFSKFAVRVGGSPHAVSTTEPRILDIARGAGSVNVGLKYNTTSSETYGPGLADLHGERNVDDHSVSTTV